jgi:hypothetical protein
VGVRVTALERISLPEPVLAGAPAPEGFVTLDSLYAWQLFVVSCSLRTGFCDRLSIA